MQASVLCFEVRVWEVRDEEREINEWKGLLWNESPFYVFQKFKWTIHFVLSTGLSLFIHKISSNVGPWGLQLALTSHSHHTMRMFLSLVLYPMYKVIVAFGFGLHESYDLFTHKLKKRLLKADSVSPVVEAGWIKQLWSLTSWNL